jgi:hypothetical protein
MKIFQENIIIIIIIILITFLSSLSLSSSLGDISFCGIKDKKAVTHQRCVLTLPCINRNKQAIKDDHGDEVCFVMYSSHLFVIFLILFCTYAYLAGPLEGCAL